jgi:hypothetical protein
VNTGAATEFALKAVNRSGWSSLAHARPGAEIQTVWSRDVEHGGVLATEFVKRSIGPSYIEPKYGYVIHRSGVLLDESMLPIQRLRKPMWRNGTPSLPSFVRARPLRATQVVHYASVISLRHWWEWNYYHFLLDVLGKLSLFDGIGLDPETPIVLGRYAMELPFVRQMLARGELADRNWIIQDNFHVCASEIYYCRSFEGYRTKMDHLLDLMAVPSNENDQSTRRVFLTRPPGPRSVLNMDEVVPVLNEYDFEIVDTTNMPVDEQIEIFARTRYLLAVHGAGMTNMIFRRDAPMSVLEIHPEVYVSEDMMNMCHEWSYDHDRLACSPGGSRRSQHSSLYVDPVALRTHIQRMLAN